MMPRARESYANADRPAYQTYADDFAIFRIYFAIYFIYYYDAIAYAADY